MSDYIIHYGIPGMKRGVRRWTNRDGTLNEAGKRRYRDRILNTPISTRADDEKRRITSEDRKAQERRLREQFPDYKKVYTSQEAADKAREARVSSTTNVSENYDVMKKVNFKKTGDSQKAYKAKSQRTASMKAKLGKTIAKKTVKQTYSKAVAISARNKGRAAVKRILKAMS